MRLAKIKDSTELGEFKDIISLQVVDGNVEAVVLAYNGQELRITAAGSYSSALKLLVEEPKEEVKRFRVKGTYMGMDIVPKEFDSQYDATQYIIELNGKLPYGEEHSLEIEEFSEFKQVTKI